ncbi:MAG: lactate utilization protein [Deltaproteobacteria bacterium]|jgi:L-lactate dehydrogenase complex protein LldG|nr:lactate utilization protein [Deltaproteobacteria bacterium]
MPGNLDPATLDLFLAKAKAATIEVVAVENIHNAVDYAIEATKRAEFGKLLPTGGPPKPATGERRKTLAAPALSQELYDELAKKGEAENFEMIRSGLREYLAGVDVSLTIASMGIAETATLIIENEREDDRLATMICETSLIVLPKSKLFKTSYETEAFLNEALGREHNYTSFISGPSRTADIERVLTLGVHGPLAMHVILLEE